ncbi:LuxR C-terminal-related transcriptional regulator [Phycicoccus sp. M110.8]|uniref:LuxR C-terminal-related transcriptional regulator n=1 Tax=Phycicoccus sp. M110.8 TaxID=3075433 RepID=UPI0028FDABC9|nr:LuxR C-terminal-related transcriptional regulator [Phycicoccus sp. M110.8]MDU0314156.1 LuxR C-terminal-related transcriptional regulator [Phycicoccus sp. M110.8]
MVRQPAVLDPLDSLGTAGTHESPRPSAIVQRRSVLSLMDAGAQRSVTLLSAPAGYGKTVVAGDWASRVHAWAAVAHTSISEEGGALDDFWTVALRALDAGGVDVSGLTAGPSPNDAGPALVREIGQRIQRHGQPVVWVLDCDEFALGRAEGQQLHRLLSASGGALRLVLLTRSDPPLPLHRYRLAGQLTEVRASELAFTVSEVAAVLRHAGVDLRPTEVSELHARTAGWPAGLAFAAMWLAGRRDTRQAIRDFRGDTANVGAYLMSEVLATQPPELQEFLLRTCLADTLYPELAGVLTGRHCDDRVLQFLAHGNTFIVPVGDGSGAYRYQPLFREFLRSELAYRRPDLVPGLHRWAAGWLAANGRYRTAMRHAVAARAWDDAARYLLDGPGVAALLVGPDRVGLRTLVAAVPADAPGSATALTRAALALGAADAETCVAELAAARRWIGVEGTSSPTSDAALLTLSAVATSLGTDLDAAVEATLAAESTVLTTTTGAAPDTPTVTLLAAVKGRVLFERGDLAAASEAFRAAAAAATTAHFDGDAVELRGMAALAEAAAGNLRRARELAGCVAPQGSGTGGQPSVAASSQAGALAMAWVWMEEYDLAAAAEALDDVHRLPSSFPGRTLCAVHALVRSRLLRAQGSTELAIASVQSLRRDGPTADVGAGWLAHALAAAEADHLVAAGRREEALGVLAELEACEHASCALAVRRTAPARAPATGDPGADDPGPWARTTSTVQTQVAYQVECAQEHLDAGDREAAERSIESALALALPEQLRRPFLESPAEVRALLRDTGRMGRLRQQTRTGPHRSPDIALTAREQEVLGHLAELLTTEEIAQAMFVSVNTVRTHVRSVLRKLDVTRRNEAVRRAWEHDLLPGRPGRGATPAPALAQPTGIPPELVPSRARGARTG